MKSIIASLVVAFALSVAAYAETDYKALAVIKDIQNGADNQNQIKTLRVKESVALPAGAITSAEILNGTIVNADIGSSAAIARSKLNLGGVNATNVIISGDSKTNTIIVLDGVITSWVITE